jgi:hypothetical protein
MVSHLTLNSGLSTDLSLLVIMNTVIQVSSFRSEQFTDEENPDLIYRVSGYQADFAISDWIPGIHYEEVGRDILARRGQSVLIDADGESHEERFAEEDELGDSIFIFIPTGMTIVYMLMKIQYGHTLMISSCMS